MASANPDIGYNKHSVAESDEHKLLDGWTMASPCPIEFFNPDIGFHPTLLNLSLSAILRNNLFTLNKPYEKVFALLLFKIIIYIQRMMSRQKLFLSLFILLGLTSLSFSQTENPEIFLFSMEIKDGKFTFSDGKNITNNPGYDSQPSFSLNNRSLLFTSNRNGKDTNIYEYFLADGQTQQITTSGDNEYTAKEFDGRTINFIREGQDQTMTIFKYDRNTKQESTALKIKEPVAYYAFNSKGDALVWLRYAFFIHWVNSEKNINRFVADYAQPSTPQLIPNTDNFSFIKRLPNDELWIYEFNPANQAVRPIVRPKDSKITYGWMPDGSLMTGSGTKLFRFDEKTDRTWVQIADVASFGIKDIGRVAISFDGKYLALVSNQ